MLVPCPACAAELYVVDDTAAASFACPKCGQSIALLKPGPATKRRKKKGVSAGVLVVATVVATLALLVAVGGVVWHFQERWVSKPAPQVQRALQAGTPQAAPVVPKIRQDLADLLQDPEEAKKKAAQDKKDLLLVFTGSDHSQSSERLLREWFLNPWGDRALAPQYVPVYLDYPEVEGKFGPVQDERRNHRLRARYQVRGYPTVVLADAQGRPYAVEGYRPGGPDAFAARAAQYRKVRDERDRLYAQVKSAEGVEQLEAARKLVEFLREKRVLRFYQDWLAEWQPLVQRLDPDNARGYAEVFFEAGWAPLAGDARYSRDKDADTFDEREVRSEQARNDAAAARRLSDWKKDHRFQDPNVAVRLHLLAGRLEGQAFRLDAAARYLRQAMTYQPTDPQLKQLLQSMAAGLPRAATGTGFVVAEGGYLLTNHHVIDGEEQLHVRLPGQPQPAPAKLVAADADKDLALLRIELPPGVSLPPVPLAPEREVQRGETVAVLGFPLGDTVGTGLKLTTGVVSAAPEKANRGMLLLDVKVNPGNSGGPLCDEHGNVLGVVTAKTGRGFQVDSYGLARPAWEAAAFVRANLKEFRPVPPRTQKVSWTELDRRVSPSVLMVVTGPLAELK